MNNKDYIPKPLDISMTELSAELIGLSEEMARNVHEVWAAGRIANGWLYGPERNDRLKTHPCLVPYEELSEEEKEYDRKTSIETLKFLLNMGFKIEKEKK